MRNLPSRSWGCCIRKHMCITGKFMCANIQQKTVSKHQGAINKLPFVSLFHEMIYKNRGLCLELVVKFHHSCHKSLCNHNRYLTLESLQGTMYILGLIWETKKLSFKVWHKTLSNICLCMNY